MTRVDLRHGDCVDVMCELPAVSVDALVTDPPYHLAFMGRAWDKASPLESQREHTRWATEALRVLKPGAHAVVFGGTRTYHRMVCGLEDAGFEIRDCLAWLYGSGFPKSLNVGNGWGTALKPAHEPIMLARKPLAGTVASNALQHGTGALNVDGCRVEGSVPQVKQGLPSEPTSWNPRTESRLSQPHDLGRWPANIVLDEAAAGMLDEQVGERPSAGVYRNPDDPKDVGARGADWSHHIFSAEADKRRDNSYAGETGGASRFFYVAKVDAAERHAGLTVPSLFTQDGPERNSHPTVKPVELMRWLCRLITPPGGTVLDPFLGSGSTGIAAGLEGFAFIGIEREPEYMRIAEARISHWIAREVVAA